MASIPLEERIDALAHLGRLAGHIGEGAPWPGTSCGLNEQEYRSLDELVQVVHQRNAWFTEPNVRHAFLGLANLMNEAGMRSWLSGYSITDAFSSEVIGIVAAGNIPMVAWHDILCVLLSGHQALVKLSSDDDVLIPALVRTLALFHPGLASRVIFAEANLSGMDRVIATGSNNTARYFEHYFGHLPHIIRKNRSSVAVLTGDETDEELQGLAQDIFLYFGLGCRNVSKVFVPADYDLDTLFKALYSWRRIIEHKKYANNYDYNKAVWMLDKVDLLDNGFVLLKEEITMASPMAALFYERYSDSDALKKRLSESEDQLQCVIGGEHVPFGAAQCPGPVDYADGVDTMEFLLRDV